MSISRSRGRALGLFHRRVHTIQVQQNSRLSKESRQPIISFSDPEQECDHTKDNAGREPSLPESFGQGTKTMAPDKTAAPIKIAVSTKMRKMAMEGCEM